MKEKIIEILKELLIEGYEFPPYCGREGRLQLVVLDEDDIDEVSDKIAGLFNQEVEKRIAERMPSEEEIMRRVRNRKDYLRELGYPTQVLVKYGDAIIETIDWLRSRLTPQVTPQDTPQEQKVEGGAE